LAKPRNPAFATNRHLRGPLKHDYSTTIVKELLFFSDVKKRNKTALLKID